MNQTVLEQWIEAGRRLSDHLLLLAICTYAAIYRRESHRPCAPELAELLGAISGVINQLEHIRRDLLPRLEAAAPKAYKEFLEAAEKERFTPWFPTG